MLSSRASCFSAQPDETPGIRTGEALPEWIKVNPETGETTADMPEGVDMSISDTGIGFDGHYVDSAGNNLAFNTNYEVSSVDVKYDSLIDFDEGIPVSYTHLTLPTKA